MEPNQFSVVTHSNEALPRSKRLRAYGANKGHGSSSSSSSSSSRGLAMGGDCGHTHSNKSVLDAQSMDAEGYLYLTFKPENADDSREEKVKAGYADDADMWDGKHFNDYLDQPVKKDDSVEFEKVTFGALQSKGFVDAGMSGKGFGVTKDANGNTVVTTDILQVRKKAEFYELVINQTTFELGETVKSLAGCEITSVEEVGDVYRCYYDTKGGNRHSGFKVGDQARCQRYNALYDGIVKYYWRVVAGVGKDYVDLYKSGVDTYGYPLVEGTDIPSEGDNIVHFGNRTDATRQNAIVIASTPTPTILQYNGIKDFTLPDPVTKISPNENKFTGVVNISAGSTGIEHLGVFGNGNLLRNSGFTGDYLSKQLQGDSELNGDSELFSPSLEHWGANNAFAQKSSESASGVEVMFADYGASYLSQVVESNILVGESYVLSFKAKGHSLSWIMGGETGNVSLTSEYKRYVVKIVAKPSENYTERYVQFSSSNATICEIQLERGTIASTWGMSMMDNTSALSFYQSLQYIASAINNGSTTVLGGLILSNMLLLGNYLNGEMKKVTAGVNGTYNNDNDVAFWTGGDHQSAIDLVTRFKDNPSQFPTDEEWESLAKFVATHGGDVFLRGYIYALGGLFKGAVDIAGGKIKLNADGSGSLANGGYSWNVHGHATRRYPDTKTWLDSETMLGSSKMDDGTPIIDFKNGGFIESHIHGSAFERVIGIPFPEYNPFSFCLRGYRYLPNKDGRPASTIFIDVNHSTAMRFIYIDDEGTQIQGSAIRFNRTAIASKGYLTIMWNNQQYVIEREGDLIIGNKDNNNCDVQIYTYGT